MHDWQHAASGHAPAVDTMSCSGDAALDEAIRVALRELHQPAVLHQVGVEHDQVSVARLAEQGLLVGGDQVVGLAKTRGAGTRRNSVFTSPRPSSANALFATPAARPALRCAAARPGHRVISMRSSGRIAGPSMKERPSLHGVGDDHLRQVLDFVQLRNVLRARRRRPSHRATCQPNARNLASMSPRC